MDSEDVIEYLFTEEELKAMGFRQMTMDDARRMMEDGIETLENFTFHNGVAKDSSDG